MKKINLKDYDFETIDNGQKVSIPYRVKESIMNMIVHPSMQHNGKSLLDAHKLAMKIEQCLKDNILLEDAEHSILLKATEAIKGLGRSEVELIRRIIEAESIDPNSK